MVSKQGMPFDAARTKIVQDVVEASQADVRAAVEAEAEQKAKSRRQAMQSRMRRLLQSLELLQTEAHGHVTSEDQTFGFDLDALARYSKRAGVSSGTPNPAERSSQVVVAMQRVIPRNGSIGTKPPTKRAGSPQARIDIRKDVTCRSPSDAGLRVVRAGTMSSAVSMDACRASPRPKPRDPGFSPRPTPTSPSLNTRTASTATTLPGSPVQGSPMTARRSLPTPEIARRPDVLSVSDSPGRAGGMGRRPPALCGDDGVELASPRPSPQLWSRPLSAQGAPGVLPLPPRMVMSSGAAPPVARSFHHADPQDTSRPYVRPFCLWD